jgi:hypothetical protein
MKPILDLPFDIRYNADYILKGRVKMGFAEAKTKALEVEKGERILDSVHGISPATGWFLLLGPLAAFMMKYYLLTITEDAIYFHRLNITSKIVQSDRFTYPELAGSKFETGFINNEFKFRFENGRKLLIRSPRKSLGKKASVLAESTVKFLKEKLS